MKDNRYLIFLCLWLLLTFCWSLCKAGAPIVPYCTADQLKIYQIAMDAPGMMKTRVLYGIINSSKTACRLHAGKPAVWAFLDKPMPNENGCPGVKVGSTVYYFAREVSMEKEGDILVTPVGNADTISSDQLVWFSFEGASAGGYGGLPLGIHKINVTLPGLVQHIYSASYTGYDGCFNLLSRIHKNAKAWEVLKSDQCVGFTGKSWPIHFKSTVRCG